METINQFSRLAAEFTLSWSSGFMSHVERYWADPVSLWRDVLDPGLVQQLSAQGSGAKASLTVPAAQCSVPFDRRRIVRVRPGQFQGKGRDGCPLIPRVGRFYPQGLLQGVGGVYRGSHSPCRFLGQDGEDLVFNLNHPLAGRELHLDIEVATVHPRQKERGGRCEDWLERISEDGPGMEAPTGEGQGWVMHPEDVYRRDEQPDELFYRQARMVHHLDRTCRELIGRHYGCLIPSGARVLDLMGSWTSHLPENIEVGHLTVLGMNDEELRGNARANATVVHDLNASSVLPFAEGAFDAVVCTASVEYLVRPLGVLAEVRRVLRPGGVVALAFSDRWFPPKVIRIWEELHGFERLGMVAHMLHITPGFHRIGTMTRRGAPRPFDDPYDLPFSDPVFMVWAQAS